MRKIKDIKVHMFACRSDLEKHVLDFLSKGWEILGGINISRDNEELTWHLTLVKYEEEPLMTEPDFSLGSRPSWLDWQENRPDNKPKLGSTVLIKMINNYIHVDYFSKEEEEFCNFEVTRIKKWAYIPE